MVEKKGVKVLPCPELHRKPIVDKCIGCERIFENHTLPEGMILVDVCISYENPEIKWRQYRDETETKQVKGKDLVALEPVNAPCMQKQYHLTQNKTM